VSAVDQALASILDRKARVALNVAGTAIGTAAVILLVALGQGAKESIISEFNSFGSGIVSAAPGHTETLGFAPAFGGNTQPITLEDCWAVSWRAQGARMIAPEAVGSARVEAKPRGRSVIIVGTIRPYAECWSFNIVSGDFLPDSDVGRGPRVAVLGVKLARELFLEENPLGKFVRVGGTRFRVIGVMQKGRALGLDLDDMAWIPIDQAMRLFDLRGCTNLNVSGGAGADTRALKEEVTRVLVERHRGRQDFTIVAQDDMLDALSSVLSAITKGLAAIAAISLVVAGVGIANTMLVTVAERRSEVGLKLALGAPREVVVLEFLVEAVLISSGGAALGLGAAVGIAGPLGRAALGAPAPTPLWIVALAALVAFVLGVSAGIWPARAASLIPPAEALREE
jgi:putative ABC transport system permease protein